MIVKIRDIDDKDWWMYDASSGVHCGSGDSRLDEDKTYLKITGESGTEDGLQMGRPNIHNSTIG